MSRLRIGRAGWTNLGLAVVLAAVLVGAYTAIGVATPTSAVGSRTTTAAQGELTATVSGSGNLASSRTASLSFGASGSVTDLDVEVGDKVTKGDELASIDTASAERDLSAARARLASAEASYSETASGATSTTAGSSGSSGSSGGTQSVSAATLGVSAAEAGVVAAQRRLADDTRTQDALVAEAQAAYQAGKSEESAVLAAKATRAQTLAKDEQGILQAKQALAGAESSLSDARSSSSSSSSSGTSTAAQLASAKVDVEDAEATVQDAEDALAATKIVAPFSGTVLSISGDVGDTVSAGTSSSSSSDSASTSAATGTGTGSTGTGSTGTGSTGTGTSSTGSTGSAGGSAFITMASTTTLEVTANIAEADIGDIKVGQDASITLPASGQTAQGTVRLVSPEGSASSNVVQYPVTITVADPPSAARIGSTAAVAITTGSVSDAVLVQSSAITTTGNRSTVTVVKNGTASTIPVELGLVGGSQTQVIGGLSAGDVVRLPASTTGTGTGTQGGLPGFGGPGAGGLGR